MSTAPLHFDLSLFDLFASFSRHAGVHLLDDSAALYPGAVRSLIDAARITVWYAVPTALARLAERRALAGATSPRLIMFAGEVFPTAILRRLMAQLPQPEYVNLFGPTETNVCTYHRLPGAPASDLDALPIGIPCEHLEVSLNRDDGSAVGGDETGEICVAGAAVMAGYWGDAEGTGAVRCGGRSDSYRTGDYAYRRPDGAMMFVGRRDQQVKIRGHRVDLLALETVLHAHPAIREAAALAVPGARGGSDLALYLVAREAALGDGAVQDAVAARLPPSYRIDRVEWLQELPRLANGKCDRIALRNRAAAKGD